VPVQILFPSDAILRGPVAIGALGRCGAVLAISSNSSLTTDAEALGEFKQLSASINTASRVISVAAMMSMWGSDRPTLAIKSEDE